MTKYDSAFRLSIVVKSESTEHHKVHYDTH